MTNLDTLTKPRLSAQTSHDTEEPVFKDGALAAHVGPCQLDRRDSGISVGSGRSSSATSHSSCDNTRSFHRQGSGRTSGYGSLRGSGRMTCIVEDDVRQGDETPAPKSLTKLRWIKVPKSKVKSKS